MTQDTEDVVASIKASLEDVFYDTLDCAFDADLLARAALEASERQSLSDRIDVAVERAEQAISAWAFAHNIDGAIRNELMARVRAVLHQEGIAPK